MSIQTNPVSSCIALDLVPQTPAKQTSTHFILFTNPFPPFSSLFLLSLLLLLLLLPLAPLPDFSALGPLLPSSRVRIRIRIRILYRRRNNNPPGRLHDARHVGRHLGQRAGHLAGEHVAEAGKGALLAARELVHAAHQLDELARVDVRVPAVLDVVDQRLRDRLVGRRGGEVVRRRVQVGEGCVEGLSFCFIYCLVSLW